MQYDFRDEPENLYSYMDCEIEQMARTATGQLRAALNEVVKLRSEVQASAQRWGKLDTYLRTLPSSPLTRTIRRIVD